MAWTLAPSGIGVDLSLVREEPGIDVEVWSLSYAVGAGGSCVDTHKAWLHNDVNLGLDGWVHVRRGRGGI